MPEAIEEALVRILADTESFEEDVREGVEKSIRYARRVALDAFKDIENAAGTAGIKVATILRPFREQAQGAITSADQLADVLDRLRGDFTRLGPEGERALERIESAIRSLDDAVVAGPRQALDQLSDETDRFATRFRAALGRAAVAGTEQLEDSFRDIRTTGQREFDVLTESIQSSLRDLAHVPGIERLGERFESLADGIQVDFAVAVANAEQDLRDMAARGELTADTLDDAVTRLAVQFDERLGGAIKEVEDDLRRLAGDERVFTEMADEIRRAERETEQLQDALLALERRSHEELANDFRQAATAIDAAEEQVEEFTAANRRAAAATTTTARAASGAYRQANSRVGHLIASLNRLRFVALDARFILSGVGIFAAAQFARFGIEATSQIEQIRLSFQVLARSIEGVSTDPFENFQNQADAALESVLDYARETPFAVEEVADAVRKLSAFLPSFNIVPPENIDTLNERLQVSQSLFTDIGGALAVLGQQDALPRLVKALGDVAARGKLTGEEMRQFANALPGIEIRTAIITGIFDPSVRASESITHLRNEFGRLGADAENAPQAALNAFTEFQRQGLITTDAVLQGLRASFRNLAGDDAIQKFTLTIAGSLEKLRESVQRGLFEGMEDLGEVMTESLLPALEEVEVASAAFGEGFADLAEASIPILLAGFEDLSVAAGDVFDAIAEFAIENRALIERGIDSIADSGVLLADILLTLFDAVSPSIPAFLELVEVGLVPLADILDALSPIIRDFSEVIDDIPTPLLAIAIGISQVNRALTGQRILEAAAAYGQFGGAVGLAQAALSKFLPVAALTIGVGIISRINDGREAAEEFIETLEQDFEGLPGIEGTTSSVEALRDRLRELRAEIPDRSLGTDIAEILNPFFLSANVNRDQEIRELEEALEQYEQTLDNISRNKIPLARQALVGLGEGFDDAQLRAALSEDVIIALADRLGIDLSQSIGTVNQAFRDAIPAAGGLGALLREMDVDLPEVDFTGSIEGAENLELAYKDAATALGKLVDEQRAAVDPVFAVIKAQSDLSDATQEYRDILAEIPGADGGQFETQEEKQRALDDALQASIDSALEVIGAFRELGDAVATGGTDADSFRREVENITTLLGDLAPEARAFVEEGLRRVIEEMPGLEQALGDAGGSVDMLLQKFIDGEATIDSSVSRWTGDWKDLATGYEAATDDIDFDETVNRARSAFDRLPEIVDSSILDLISTITVGNDSLFTSLFEFGRAIVDRIQSGIDSSSISGPRYGFDNVLPAPSPTSPSGTTSGLGDSRTATSAGLTVNQTITTTDPVSAGRESTRQFSNELFLRGV